MILPGPDNACNRIIRGLLYAWILALVLLLYPYTEDPATPIKHLASAGFALAMTTVWAIGVATQRIPVRRIHAPYMALLIFLAIQMLSSVLSDTPARSFVALQPWCVFALIGLVGYQVCTSTRHLRNLLRAIVLGVALSSLYGLAQYAGFDPFPWESRDMEEYRGLPSTYGNPNVAGHALVIALVACAALQADAWQRRKRALEPVAWAIVAAPMLAHLYLSGMRGGVLALVAAACFVAVFGAAARWKYTPVRAGLLALSVTVAFLGMAIVAALLWLPISVLDSSLQLRLNGYAGAAALYLDNGLLGIGPGNYAAQSIAYWSDFESLWYALEGKRNFHVHNEWLEIAVASGFFGLAAFVALYLLAIQSQLAPGVVFRGRAVASHALRIALPAILVAAGVDALTGFNLHAPVSGALFFLLVTLQPCNPTSLPVLCGFRRAVPALAVFLAILCAVVIGYTFQGERHYQRAQGAMAWAQAQRSVGETAAASHGVTAARASLAVARAYMPWSYRVPMLAGDFELGQAQFRDAVSSYVQALALAPDLPRLHVQLARAQLRIANEVGEPERARALEQAAYHADIARSRCPKLAEAWEMLGWAAYQRAIRDAGDGTRTYFELAVERFTRARALGLAENINLNTALASAHGQLGDWNAATPFFERCALAEPATAAHWERFAHAAEMGAGPWPVRHRQALLHALARGVDGNTCEALTARLVTTVDSPASARLIRGVLRDVVQAHPERLALWGAWLESVDDADRADALVELAALQPSARLPETLRVLLDVVTAPESMALDRAAEALSQALATAPGGERTGPEARAYRSLLDLVAHIGVAAQRWEAAHATTRVHLGAARFEAGEPEKAEALLREAEQRLPVDQRAYTRYYRSRALLALGQPAAALPLAQQAAREEGASLEYGWQLARCMAATGEEEAAVYLYQSLMSRLPPNHPYRPLLDQALAQLQSHESEGRR